MRQLTVCIALICTFLCPAGYGQWVQTNGPYGGTVRSLLVSGPKAFAGIGHGVYFSADSGKNWEAANTGLPYDSDGYLPYVNTLAVSGTNLFAGTDGTHVYLSTNDGTTWADASTGLPYDSTARTRQSVVAFALMPVPGGGTNLFAAVNWTARGPHGSIFLSTDNGTTWTYVNNGLPDTYVNDLAVSGTILFAGTDSSVFLSTDNGSNWSVARTGLPNDPYSGGVQGISSLVVSGSNIFAGLSTDGVYLSADSGKSWIAANSGLPGIQLTWRFNYYHISDLSVGPESGGAGVPKLYACTYEGVYVSTNNGTSWTEAFAPLPEGTVSKFVDNGVYYLAATETGLVRSTDGATTWNYVPVTATSVQCFDSDASRLFVGVYRRVFCTMDRGTNWSPKGKLSAPYGLYCLTIAGPNLLAGGTCTVGRVDISTDEGLTWRAALDTTASPPFPAGSKYGAEALLVAEPSVFTAGNGIWMSSDNGNSWKRRDEGIVASSYFFALAALDTNLFAGGSGSGGNMFISNVSGGPWRSAGTGLQGAYVKCLTVNGATLFAGTWDRGVYRSTDLGATWTPASHGLGDSVILALAGNGPKLFAGTEHQGVFLSTNNGTTWTAVNEGLKNVTVNALEIFGLDLYAGTGGRGVWRRPLSELVVSVEGAAGAVPHEYRLSQNYPNPFNPTTTIKYELPNSSVVRLIVYDILGREVSVLVNERKEAGVHEVKFDAAGLSSGVYLYRLQAGEFTQTKRLLPLR